MTLATVENSHDNSVIQTYVNSTAAGSGTFWLGATDLFNSTKPPYNEEYNYYSWSWLKGNSGIDNNLRVHYWLKNHPAYSSGKHCLYTTKTVTTVVQTGLGPIYIYSNWGATDCVNGEHKIICEIQRQ